MLRFSAHAFRIAPAILALLLAGQAAEVRADDDGQKDHDRPPTSARDEPEDYDRILDFVRQGKIRPLPPLKAMVLSKWPGELVGLTIDTENGAVLYEFRVLRADGKLTEIEVDATDGRIMEVENE